MKNFNRWLSILMCLCMLSTSMFGDFAAAFAEMDSVSVTETQADASAPDEEIELELGGDEPAGQDADAQETAVVSSEKNTAVDFGADAGKSSAFQFGYAQIIADAPLYVEYNAETEIHATLMQGGVVLVVERRNDSGHDRVLAFFEYNDAMESGWLDAGAVRPMSDEQVQEFQNGITEALCWQNDVNYPLDVVSAVLPGDSSEQEKTEVGYDETNPDSENVPAGNQTIENENTDDQAENDSGDKIDDADENNVESPEATEDEENTVENTPVVDAPEVVEGEDTTDATEGEEPAGEDMPVVDDPEAVEGEDTTDATEGEEPAGEDMPVVDDPEAVEGEDTTDATEGEEPAGEDMPVVDDPEAVEGEDTTDETEGEEITGDDMPVVDAPEAVEGEDTTDATEGEEITGDDMPVVDAPEAVEGEDTTDETEGEEITGDDMPVVEAPEAVEGEDTTDETEGEEITGDDMPVVDAPEAVEGEDITDGTEVEDTAGNDMPVVDDPEAVEGENTSDDSEGEETSGDDMPVVVDPAPVEGEKSDAEETDSDGMVPCELHFLEEHLVLAVGEVATTGLQSLEGEHDIAYALTDSSVVSVDADGFITANAEGTASVKAACRIHGVSADLEVEVIAARPVMMMAMPRNIPSISIEPSSLEMMKGETASVVATAINTEEIITYFSNDVSIAAVDAATGAVTAVAPGSCVIGAKAGDELIAECALTVFAVAESFEASLASELDVGVSAQIAIALPEYTKADFQYTTSDASIAEVSADGIVTAKGKGPCTITVVMGALSKELTLVVYDVPDTFAATLPASELDVGQTMQILVATPEYTRGDVVYASKDASVANVTSDGLVTAVSGGVCEITVTLGGVTQSLMLTVYEHLAAFDVVLEAPELEVGYRTKVSAVLPQNEYMRPVTVEYTTSDAAVATVDANGVVTAVGEGSCEIIATANGVSASRTLTVRTPAIVLNKQYLDIAVGESFALTAVAVNAGSLEGGFEFATSDSAVASVDAATGAIKAVAKGTATVTLKLATGEYADCYVTVHPAPTAVKIISATTTVGISQVTEPIGYELYAGEEKTVGGVTFKTSNKKYVQVNADGQIKGVKKGKATVTVTTYNGASAKFTVNVKNAPKSISLKPSNLTLALGQSATITYSLTSGTAAGVTFTSSDPSVATVDQYGNVVALNVGSTNVTARTHNGKSKTCPVTVTKAPENVYLSLSSDKLGVGMAATAVGSVDTTSSVSFGYVYSTDRADVVAVDAYTGVVTAKAIGEANIFVKTYNDVNSQASGEERVITSRKISVVHAPETVTIDGSTINVIQGKVFMLPVMMTRSDGAECLATYTLKTSNKKYVAVNANGEVKGVKAGKKATVTVTTSNGLTATCTVVVRKSPSKVTLSPSSLTIGEGTSATLTAKISYSGGSFTYNPKDQYSVGSFTSSNPEIATVTADGVVTGHVKGTATITFKTLNGKSKSCTVTVKAKPTVVYLDKYEAKLGVGMGTTLTASYKSDEMGQTVFAAKDEASAAIVDVTSNGVITAKAVGTAVVVGTTTENNCTAECVVKVVHAPDAVAIDGGTINVIQGKTFKLPVVMTQKDGAECLATYTLKTSNKKYVAVNANGEVKGVKAGKKATVTVTTSNGLTATCTVVVRKSPSKVTLSPSSLTIGEGTSATLTAKISYSGGSFTYNPKDQYSVGSFTSSNPEIATVTADGVVTGHVKGTATITFKTLNGKSKSCTVTVKAKPTVVYLDKYEAKLGVGMGTTLTASYKSDEMGQTVFAAKDEASAAIVDVTSNGVITAKAAGTAVVVGTTTENNCTAECVVKVVHAPDAVAIDGGTINVIQGKTFKLPVVMTQKDGAECLATYTLKTSNKKYVAVNANGEVKGVKAGKKATVTVTTSNGLTATCTVVVRKSPSKVTLSPSSLTIGEGTSATLTAKISYSGGSFTYNPKDQYSVGSFTSSNPEIATVTADGVVTGHVKGTATITFKTLNGKSKSCTVTVKAKPTVVYLDKYEAKLGVGMGTTLTASYKSDEMGQTVFAAKDEASAAIVDVTSNGVITAKAVGTAVVVGTTTENNCTAECVVKVVHAPDAVAIDGGTINVIQGKTFKLPVVMTQKDGAECLATYSLKTSNKKYVAVNANGEVKGVKAGKKATVTVTTSNGLTAKCTVVVRKSPSKVTLSASSLTLGVNMTASLQAKISYSGGSFIYNPKDQYSVGTFTSSNPAVATVDGSGNITGVAKGDATITFKTLNGKSKSCTVTVYDAPNAIYLNKSATRLGVNMAEQLVVSFNPYELGDVSYASDNTNVVTISGGLITAVGVGRANVMATSNGHTATCAVEVVPGPDSISVTSTLVNLPVGKTMTLNPVATYKGSADACMANLSYSTSNKKYVTVDANGKIKGVKAGSANITIKAQNGASTVVNVKVRKTPTKVALSASKVKLGVGQTFAIQGKIYYSGGNFIYTPGDVAMAVFESNNTAVATVDSYGVITAVGEGTANIIMRTYNGKKSGSCVVTVGEGTEWLEFEEQNVALSVDQSKTVYCDKSAGSTTTRTYASGNPGIVSVVGNDATCTITAVAPGSATITATSSNGKTATMTVTVYARPESVAFAENTETIGVNQTEALPAIAVGSSVGECSQSVTYSTDNAAVATVSNTGYVTGVAAGTAKITATTYNGLTATCTVNVTAAPGSISVSSDRTDIAVGETAQVTVAMDRPGDYSFEVEDSSILSIDANGLVRAKAVGTSKVTATTYNGKSASCQITVRKLPGSVTLSTGSMELGVGMSKMLTATISSDSAGSIAYSSSDNNVATVDANGNVTAVAPGTARITAYVALHKEVFDTCEITVRTIADIVSLSDGAIALKTGASAKLTAKLMSGSSEDCYGSLAFRSSDANVAAVTDAGVVTAKGKGSAIITAYVREKESVAATCTVTVADAKVYLNVSSLVLGLGETYRLGIETPFGVDGMSIASNNPAVATVSADGVITALAKGTSTITVTNGGETANCTVTVADKPTGVSISSASKQLAIGESFALNAQVQPAGSASQLKYSVDTEGIVSVSADGTVTAIAPGTVNVKVSAYDSNVSATCAVSVVCEPDMIRFGELGDIILAKGDAYVLQKPVMYSAKGVCDADYTLAVFSDGSVSVSLGTDGRYVITAKEEGTATLRLKTDNGKTATCKVTVEAAPAAIVFEAAAVTMAQGETWQPVVIGDNDAVVAVNLSSANSGIVSVTADGMLQAEAVGETTVTASAKAYPGLTATLNVKVAAQPTTISLNAAAYTLGVGERFKLVPSADTGAANITYASGNEAVIQVDGRGNVLAAGKGSATVTASTANGKTASCSFTVMDAPTALTISPDELHVCLKDQVELNAIFGTGSEYANVIYSSSDVSVAKITGGNTVTFGKIGTAVITAQTYNGLTAEVPVEVFDTPGSVRFEHNSAVILKGDEADLEVLFDKGAGHYELKSSDESVLRVDEHGHVEALKLGSVTVTLSLKGVSGLTASCTIQVVDKLDGVVLTATEDTIELNGQTELSYTLLPENAIGTGLVTIEALNPEYAYVDGEGVVTGVAYGKAAFRATAAGGASGECIIEVLGGKRRMLIAHYFGETGDAGYLPFASNNGSSMKAAFSVATVEGQKYDIAGPMSNVPKAELFRDIDTHFRNATDNDVSVLYLCAHGSSSFGPNGEYAFSLRKVTDAADTSGYVTASELMNHLEKIKGRVVVIMDSCHSGGLIDCLRSRLDAQGGRISIISSSHRSTTSSYYNVDSKVKSVDFYTFAVLEALGYNESQGANGRDRGWFSTNPPSDSNQNGEVTLSEIFAYAQPATISYVKKNYGSKTFKGNVNQTPQSYYGANADLVLFAR